MKRCLFALSICFAGTSASGQNSNSGQKVSLEASQVQVMVPKGFKQNEYASVTLAISLKNQCQVIKKFGPDIDIEKKQISLRVEVVEYPGCEDPARWIVCRDARVIELGQGLDAGVYSLSLNGRKIEGNLEISVAVQDPLEIKNLADVERVSIDAGGTSISLSGFFTKPEESLGKVLSFQETDRFLLLIPQVQVKMDAANEEAKLRGWKSASIPIPEKMLTLLKLGKAITIQVRTQRINARGELMTHSLYKVLFPPMN